MPEFGFVEDQNFSRSSLGGKGLARDFERPVLGAVVDHNHAQIRIVRIERRPHRSLNDFFFVVRRNQHRNFRLVRGDFRRLAENLLVHAVIDGSRADKDQAPGHQQVAHQKDPGNEDNDCVE